MLCEPVRCCANLCERSREALTQSMKRKAVFESWPRPNGFRPTDNSFQAGWHCPLGELQIKRYPYTMLQMAVQRDAWGIGIGFYTVPEAARLLKIPPVDNPRGGGGVNHFHKGGTRQIAPLL